jgi:hypothetical protein
LDILKERGRNERRKERKKETTVKSGRNKRE